LSPHVHLCVAGKQVVLLDLERDKYLAVAHAHPVGRWVRGWPALASPDVAADFTAVESGEVDKPDAQGGAGGIEVSTPNSQATAVPRAGNRLLEQMIAQRLLVTDPSLGKEAAPIAAYRAKVALVEPELHTRAQATMGHFWRLLRAYAAAKWSLKRYPIKAVVEGVRLRKKRSSAATPALEIDTVRSLVAGFIYLRPLLYTAHNACLLDSLALTRYLASYGVFTDWVFGVKTDPFHAHCWVQQGEYVFNDSPDHVGEFAPILVV
jgi:hypothetical protein